MRGIGHVGLGEFASIPTSIEGESYLTSLLHLSTLSILFPPALGQTISPGPSWAISALRSSSSEFSSCGTLVTTVIALLCSLMLTRLCIHRPSFTGKQWGSRSQKTRGQGIKEICPDGKHY
jgi:hypothetical protein